MLEVDKIGELDARESEISTHNFPIVIRFKSSFVVVLIPLVS